jgi:RNA-binding protein
MLTKQLTRELRQRGHKLRPIVMIGSAGLTEGVLREIDLSLTHHELIKIRVSASDRVARQNIIDEICDTLEAQPVQQIGHVALLYREPEE